MRNTYVDNWQIIKERFEQWWNHEKWDKPLMSIIASGKTPISAKNSTPEKAWNPADSSDLYLDVAGKIGKYRDFCETHYFLADAFPSGNVNLGPGSMALYLGGEPGFDSYTVWYKEKCRRPDELRNLHYDENNHWWKLHQKMMRDAVELAAGDFYIGIPDIIENLDILSALRGPQNLCFDILDEPELIKEGVKIIDNLYFRYYDRCYDLVKDDDLSVCYTSFNILGRNRVAKIQCDFSALISPELFREYVVPSLTKQCQKLDHSVYHLDGPDAIKHLPALMEIKELDALQWTCGAGKPDGGSENWYPVYDTVHDAGKSLHISLHDGSPEEWARRIQSLVKRYGTTGLYFLFPVFPDLPQARKMAALFDR